METISDKNKVMVNTNSDSKADIYTKEYILRSTALNMRATLSKEGICTASYCGSDKDQDEQSLDGSNENDRQLEVTASCSLQVVQPNTQVSLPARTSDHQRGNQDKHQYPAPLCSPFVYHHFLVPPSSTFPSTQNSRGAR